MKIMIVDEDCKKLREERESLWSKLRDALDHAEGWEKRCAELEQENRELKEALGKERKKYEALQQDQFELLDEVERLTDVKLSQDVTISKYDDENKRLKGWLHLRTDGADGHKWDEEMLEDYGYCEPPKHSLND